MTHAELRKLIEAAKGDAFAAVKLRERMMLAAPRLLALMEAAEALHQYHDCGCGYCDDLRAAVRDLREGT